MMADGKVQLYEGKVLRDTGKVATAEACCCGGCDCTCACCKNNQAPCCWKVVIAGIVNDNCTDCDELNGTYYLPQNAEDPCVWSNSSACLDLPCEIEGISLAVTCNEYDGTNYRITVTLGGHTWEKDYGDTPPNCCELADEELTHVTSGTDCDSSAATCHISARNGPCTSFCCEEYCADGEAPSTLTVTVKGIADGTCKHCECFNYEFALEIVNPCWWECDNAIEMPCEICSDYIGKVTAILGWGFAAPNVYRLTVTLEDRSGNTIATYQTGWPEKPECMQWADLELSLVSSSSWAACDLSASSVTVNSSHGSSVGGAVFEDNLCTLCECGDAPDNLRVDISGTTNGLCSTCNDLNNTYIAVRRVECGTSSCAWTCPLAVCQEKGCFSYAKLNLILQYTGQLWCTLTRPTAGGCGGMYLARGYVALSLPLDCLNLDVTITLDDFQPFDPCSHPPNSVRIRAA